MLSAEGVPNGVNGVHHSDWESQPYDLVCVGFGPASLSIAIALKDKGIEKSALYLEKQEEFRWHAGMLLPDARMQISFLKDLATLRDPRSHFTFLNYLKCKDRLVQFTNLSTFLPLREEYNDYLTWCASHFQDQVQYGWETTSIEPIKGSSGKIEQWAVHSRNTLTNKEHVVTARRVVIAVGGRPNIPSALFDPSPDSQILHSSSYSTVIPKIVADRDREFNLAIVGGGQSAAEIFNDLQTRFTNTRTTLFTGDQALRPSDDSPFVNEIFDPEKVDDFYGYSTDLQKQMIQTNRSTNYGVVRPELLDRLYEAMYHQRLHEPDESLWRHKISTRKHVEGYEKQVDRRLRLKLKNKTTGAIEVTQDVFDLLIVATGYVRNAHEMMLDSTKHLLEDEEFVVQRDYSVNYRAGALASDCGVWLQGCCEGSHGLSDTLLSILSVRGGEMVDSLFPSEEPCYGNGKPKIHHRSIISTV